MDLNCLFTPNYLTDVLPEVVIRMRTAQGRMDSQTLNIWYKIVFKTYVSGCKECSRFILDDFRSSRISDLHTKMDDFNVDRWMSQPHYTTLLQSCKFGIYKALKDRLKTNLSAWRREKHATLFPIRFYLCQRGKKFQAIGWRYGRIFQYNREEFISAQRLFFWIHYWLVRRNRIGIWCWYVIEMKCSSY